MENTRSMPMDVVERGTRADGVCRVTIAANESARHPPDLDFDGLSVDNYLRNPVVMWAHDSVGRSPSGGLPIGRTLGIWKTPEGRIVAEFEFLGGDPFAQRVKNAWDKGFLQAASISWMPVETAPAGEGRWRDVRSELLEWSIVSVPADPEALRQTHRRMLGLILGEEPDSPSLQSALAELRSTVAQIKAAIAGGAPETAAPGNGDVPLCPTLTHINARTRARLAINHNTKE